jgi:hypothetical protein
MDEYTPPKLSEYVAALQLLLSDLNADSRAFVLQEAFPDIVLLATGDRAVRARSTIASAGYYLNAAASLVDGSSGLGAVAATNAAGKIASAKGNLQEAMRLLSIREAQ